MPEQESEYHPAVEEIMETSGPDVGRIKDKDVARVVGEYENMLLDSGPMNEKDKNDRVDRSLKLEIANQAAQGMSKEIARHQVDGDFRTEEGVVESYSKHLDNAGKAIASYDKLKEDAKAPHLEEHNKYLQGQLDEARKKIAETDQSN